MWRFSWCSISWYWPRNADPANWRIFSRLVSSVVQAAGPGTSFYHLLTCVHVCFTSIGENWTIRVLMSISIRAVTIKLSRSDPNLRAPWRSWAVSVCQECGDDLYWRVIISESWDNITSQIRTIPFHSLNNVHDEMRLFTSYIYTFIKGQGPGHLLLEDFLIQETKSKSQPRWICIGLVILMKRKSKLYQWHYSTIYQVANCYNKITDQRKYFMPGYQNLSWN